MYADFVLLREFVLEGVGMNYYILGFYKGVLGILYGICGGSRPFQVSCIRYSRILGDRFLGNPSHRPLSSSFLWLLFRILYTQRPMGKP